MKRALLIGIDAFDTQSNLSGCVNDVHALAPLLSRNEDDSPNFDCRTITSDVDRVARRTILEAIDHLLAPGADIALLYFASHGSATNNDVILVTQDGVSNEPGVPLSLILGKVQTSNVREVFIILDCCFAGGGGGVPQIGENVAVLREGVALLGASRSDQTAAELPSGRGLFSFYLCGALEGGAADVLGKVTLAGVYAYLSESFGPWDQRPTFKANLDRLHEIRRCSPAVPIEELRRLPEFFPEPDHVLPLDSSYEPDAEPKHPVHEAVFAILQRCRAAKLVVPIGTEHMYYAAIQKLACQLTPLGKHYLRMATQGQL